MKALFSLALLALLAWGGYWYLTEARQREGVQRAEEELAKGASRLKDAIEDKLKNSSLRGEDIKEELSRSGKVVRQMAREVGAAVTEATVDARITAAIKAKLLTDSDLSALSISVNTTYGVVTLSGMASSYDAIGKAILLALEADGVREVVSTLQIRIVK